MSTLIVKNLDAPTGESIVAPDLQLPSGSVVQVVHNQTTTDSGNEITTTSTSLVGSGIQVRITPTSSTSKILVHFHTGMWEHDQASNIRGQMYVNGSAWTNSGQYQLGFGWSGNRYGPAIFEGIWESGSTDEILFEPYFRSSDSGLSAKLLHNNAAYMLYAMEIAG
jgi:hypothetical protein